MLHVYRHGVTTGRLWIHLLHGNHGCCITGVCCLCSAVNPGLCPISTLSQTHTRVRVLLSVWFLVFMCVCVHVCLLNSKAFIRLSDEGSNQSRVNATSEPRPLLVKELLCHFAPTCTSLTPLRNLGPRAVGESKILGSVSRSSQGRPRTFRDAAETIRKSRASLSVSVIKLGGKLECVCAVFFSSSLQLQDFTTGST